jgi:hypothetical protein
MLLQHFLFLYFLQTFLRRFSLVDVLHKKVNQNEKIVARQGAEQEETGSAKQPANVSSDLKKCYFLFYIDWRYELKTCRYRQELYR